MDTSLFETHADYIQNGIEVAARKLIASSEIPEHELPSLRSEMTHYVMCRLVRYDQLRCRFKTFVSMAIQTAAGHALRDYRAGKRHILRIATPLHEAVASDDGCDTTLDDVLDADGIAIDAGRQRRSRHDQSVLRQDVAGVLDGLPSDLRTCCLAIMEGTSVVDLARERGMARSSFRDQVMVPIRDAFVAAGLDAWQ